MVDPAQAQIAMRGASDWNTWRHAHPDRKVDLAGADLSGADLAGADLSGANLRGSILTHAKLMEAALCGRCHQRPVSLSPKILSELHLGAMPVTWADLGDANLSTADMTKVDASGANLRGAHLAGVIANDSNFTWANLESVDAVGAKFRAACFFESYLMLANLKSAALDKADLRGAKLEGALLHGARLSNANLCRASLIDSDLAEADLDGAFVHGTAAWNVRGVPGSQKNLVITRTFPPYNEPLLTVDDLEIAQFIYLLLNNQRIRDVIDTITSRAVLILGRFAPPRKAVLEAVRNALRDRGYVPLLFDFVPSAERDLTETVVLLASLSKFVVAELTDARSIPQELSAIVPVFVSLPVVPLIQQGAAAYSMFEHWRKFRSVLEIVQYRDTADLLNHLDSDVIDSAERFRNGADALKQLQLELTQVKEERDALKKAVNEQRPPIAADA